MRVALAAVLLALVMPGAATAAPDPPDPGTTESGSITSGGTEFPYLLYTPTTYGPDRPAPLVVVVHGCQTTAATELKVTRFNQLAEREGFVVLYPEVDAIGQNLPGPLNHCWRFFDPTAYFRGNGDTAALAEMTRHVMARLSVDAERVYMIGVSAGGLMTAAAAAAYPDLYAAVGIVTSAGYADGTCFATGVGTPVAANAQLAFAAMGPHARVVPLVAIGSDADLAFPAACTDKALEQGLRTNNLVLSGSQTTPLALAPGAVRELQVPDGLASP